MALDRCCVAPPLDAVGPSSCGGTELQCFIFLTPMLVGLLWTSLGATRLWDPGQLRIPHLLDTCVTLFLWSRSGRSTARTSRREPRLRLGCSSSGLARTLRFKRALRHRLRARRAWGPARVRQRRTKPPGLRQHLRPFVALSKQSSGPFQLRLELERLLAQFTQASVRLLETLSATQNPLGLGRLSGRELEETVKALAEFFWYVLPMSSQECLDKTLPLINSVATIHDDVTIGISRTESLPSLPSFASWL